MASYGKEKNKIISLFTLYETDGAENALASNSSL